MTKPEEQVAKWTGVGLGRIAEPLAQLAKPALRVKKGMAKPVREVASKFGGEPHVPADFEWPRFEEKPLTFLAQWRLAEVAPLLPELALPDTGLLSFFYESEEQPFGGDPSDADGWRVYHFAEEDLIRTAPPDDFENEYPVTERAIEFIHVLSYPDQSEQAITDLSLTKEESQILYRADDEREKEFQQSTGEKAQHQIGGWSSPIQGQVFDECQIVFNKLDPDASQDNSNDDWRLLFQIDSDDKLGVMWGDAGFIYFCIRQQDLSVHDFSKVWLIMQCS